MSISFRNDSAAELRLINDLHAEPRAVDNQAFTTTTAVDSRSPEQRSNPDVRSIDVRLTELRNGATARELPDVKMDQIRELLFGEVQRQSEQRIITLEAKVRELETALNHRLDAMQARIEALAAETRGDRRSTLDELTRGIADLGDRVKRIPRD